MLMGTTEMQIDCDDGRKENPRCKRMRRVFERLSCEHHSVGLIFRKPEALIGWPNLPRGEGCAWINPKALDIDTPLPLPALVFTGYCTVLFFFVFFVFNLTYSRWTS